MARVFIYEVRIAARRPLADPKAGACNAADLSINQGKFELYCSIAGEYAGCFLGFIGRLLHRLAPVQSFIAGRRRRGR